MCIGLIFNYAQQKRIINATNPKQSQTTYLTPAISLYDCLGSTISYLFGHIGHIGYILDIYWIQ